MSDPRVDKLAHLLVNYSTRVGEGDVVAIRGDSTAAPLLRAIYDEVLRAGGFPEMLVTLEGQAASFYELASERQLDYVPATYSWSATSADVMISVHAPANTRELSHVPPERLNRSRSARSPVMERMMQRSAEGQFRWVGTNFPTQALAAEANMGLAAYERLYYEACHATADDPVEAWRRQAAETQRLTEWIQDREEVHITGPGTDLKLAIAGRTFVPAIGDSNMPDGEFFTGPVEDSANGHIQFHLPAVYAGRDVAGVRLVFRDGKVVDASADVGEDFLIETLDSDDGARFLGELGVGTNFSIPFATRDILLDEKIGGTVHLAIGQSYPETGGLNKSAVHWDMICDLRRGGSITVDGETLQRDGAFVI